SRNQDFFVTGCQGCSLLQERFSLLILSKELQLQARTQIRRRIVWKDFCRFQGVAECLLKFSVPSERRCQRQMSIWILKTASDKISEQLDSLFVGGLFDKDAAPQVRGKFVVWLESLGLANEVFGLGQFPFVERHQSLKQ